MSACTACSRRFTPVPADNVAYERLLGHTSFMLPTICPECRRQQRLMFRNERALYRRSCDHCQKSIVSVYADDAPFPVFCNACWWSDEWSALDFSRELDFDRPFFEQFGELMAQVPKRAMMVDDRSENCDFSPYLICGKNCYLCISGSHLEDSLYCYFLQNPKGASSRDCVDCACCYSSELCYECLDCSRCYDVSFSQGCSQCTESAFLINCYSCTNCFCSTNLSNKEFYIFNKQYSKEQYHEIVDPILKSRASIEEVAGKLAALTQDAIRRSIDGLNNENVVGNFIANSNDAINCFDVDALDSCSWVSNVGAGKDCHHSEYFLDSELCYQTLSSPGSYNVAFSEFTWNSNDVLYSSYCFYSKNIFGCVGLKRKQHCILNREYSEAEYQALRTKLLEHMLETDEWGQFFPAQLSPFAYNESIASLNYPLSEQDARARGYRWREEPEFDFSGVKKRLSGDELPDTIAEVSDDILDWAIECPASGRLFRLQKSELAFYRKQSLPVPKFHPDVRHQQRMAKRSGRELCQRPCNNCGDELLTVYLPDQAKRVLCENCYAEEIF